VLALEALDSLAVLGVVALLTMALRLEVLAHLVKVMTAAAAHRKVLAVVVGALMRLE
jgi:hypothetical protein